MFTTVVLPVFLSIPVFRAVQHGQRSATAMILDSIPTLQCGRSLLCTGRAGRTSNTGNNFLCAVQAFPRARCPLATCIIDIGMEQDGDYLRR